VPVVLLSTSELCAKERFAPLTLLVHRAFTGRVRPGDCDILTRPLVPPLFACLSLCAQLSVRRMGDKGMCYLAAALVGGHVCRLRTLWLTNCDMGPDGARALAAVLYYSESLETLNITLNKIGDTGAEYLRWVGRPRWGELLRRLVWAKHRSSSWFCLSTLSFHGAPCRSPSKADAPPFYVTDGPWR
jgi:hypothetical protein